MNETDIRRIIVAYGAALSYIDRPACCPPAVETDMRDTASRALQGALLSLYAFMMANYPSDTPQE